MGKNKFGGNKAKRKKNTDSEKSTQLIYKQEGQNYGRIDRVLGNKRFEVVLPDGTKKLGIVAGSLRKRIWINKDDIVLLDLWDFQDEKCSISHKYSEENISELITSNEITEKFKNENVINEYNNLDEYDPFEWDTNTDDINNIEIKDNNSYLKNEFIPIETEEINFDEI